MSTPPAARSAPRDIESLVREWETRDPGEWKGSRRYLELGREAIALGQATLGFDILKEGLAESPQDTALRYYSALALAKSGARGYAASQLDQLLSMTDLDTHLRSEALSLAGRLAKDRYAVLDDAGARERAALQSHERYLQAYALSHEFFPGVNAATMSVLGGRAREGRQLAREVLDRCLATTRGGDVDDHWLCATLGEASVVLGERDGALQWYRRARDIAGRRYGEIASMRRQLKLLAPRLELAAEALGVLRMPRVAMFAGHMLDRPDRPLPRFPPGLAPAVEAAIGRALDEVGAGFAYCSAACGADILFIEQAIARGVEVNVMLPYGREDFIRTSVSFAGTGWVERFDRALAAAATATICVDEGYLGDDMLHGFCAQQLQGVARLRAQQLETEPLLLAVADPGSAEEAGGTQSTIQDWRAPGGKAKLIDLRALRGDGRAEARPAEKGARPAAAPQRSNWGRRQIMTMLFGDVVGFSRLKEAEAPSFFVNFLGLVARQIEQSAAPPASCNTWGDGLYLVFNDVAAAAQFALGLRDRIARTDWQSHELPVGLSARIGMHSGPVFQAFDPIIQRTNYFGSHVTRAARIEPVTAPGGVYVSEQTAAMLAAGGNAEFACDYLGRLALAKGYGAMPLYRLRRAREDE